MSFPTKVKARFPKYVGDYLRTFSPHYYSSSLFSSDGLHPKTHTSKRQVEVNPRVSSFTSDRQTDRLKSPCCFFSLSLFSSFSRRPFSFRGVLAARHLLLLLLYLIFSPLSLSLTLFPSPSNECKVTCSLASSPWTCFSPLSFS